jgi:molybdopterin molybdotransferase
LFHYFEGLLMALLSVTDALQRVLVDANLWPSEYVTLTDAFERVLAQDLAALRTQPPAALSSMDGYAVRADDIARAPVALQLIGEVAAGHPFAGIVKTGEAVRIFTGGVVPEGADTVVIQERTARDNDRVTILKTAVAGTNVRREGLDFREGEILLRAGRRLTDRDVMLAAAMNHATLPVYRRPKVAIIGTGDELIAPGGAAKPGEIVYSNGFAIAALARNEGAEAVDFGVVPDRVDAIADAVRRARDWGADVLVTTGGASVGDHDLVQKALAAEGLALSFWRVAMRPGRPMMHGKLGPMQVLGVPGNPVSSYVCSFLFLVPLLRKLMGRKDITRTIEQASLGRALPANDEREDYLRATLQHSPDGLVATPVTIQDSSLMAPLAHADCLVIREPHAPAAPAGARCRIFKLD